MPISTNDAIIKFDSLTEVTSGTPASIANNAYGKADQGATVNWTNADDAEFAAAVLRLKFTTNPTVGSVALYAHPIDVQSTNEPPAPTANFDAINVGVFPLSFSTSPVANDTFYHTVLPFFIIPSWATAQRIDWYIKNVNTSQTIAASWQLWIVRKALGPHA